ncbi:zinc finger CCCH domain-containing protein 11A-like isoform X2 [Salvelinus fontinalis]|nr:zinc finger CCCH domain-containing protein 11A-like isoform X2 [Salvelinus fontinalis]XP_055724868.1 zinc finger CCCH domain-containing protein 11A-like isoform X2 [Salvelinus fontinalis]
MEIKKNRKEMACYWENQPAGCQKPHCAFHHEKPRFIDGQYVPPNKSFALKEEVEPHEDPLPPVSAPIPVNPQLHGVIKAETQENVPSPTHPPVVINPADDDEDEDDQFSEGEDSRYGSDGSRVVSPRKMAVASNSDESLNFGVRTLEDIRLRKALKASMRIAGYPVPGQGSDQGNNGMSSEKENMKSFMRPSLFTAKDVPAGGDMPMNRRLAERLGRNMEEDEMDLPPRKAVKPVRDRLGLPVEPIAASESAESNSKTTASEVIRIKTLEEIRHEKLAKTRGQGDDHRPLVPDTTASKASKKSAAVKSAAGLHVKTFSEILHAKRKLEEDQGPSLRKAKLLAVEAALGNSQRPPEPAMPMRVAPPGGRVKVKTLEEIRREKAARMQALGQEASNGKIPGSAQASKEEGAKKSCILLINKPASAASTTTQKTSEVTEKEKPAEPAAVATEATPANGSRVSVKTFEEIMHEKRLRRQQLQEEQASSTSHSEQASSTSHSEQASSTSHSEQASSTSHSEQASSTSHSEQASSTSHSEQASSTSHSEQASSTSHSEQASSTSHSEQASSTSHSDQASSTSHSEQASSTSHSEQASSTSHSEQASYTSHSEQASSTSHSEHASSTSQSEGFAKAESTQKQAGGPAPQREKRVWVSPSAASSPPTITLEAPAHAPMAPSPLLWATLPPQQGTPLRQAEPDSPSLSPRSLSTAPGKRERGSPGGSSPPKQAALASATSPRPSVEEAPVEKAGQATETKVRPKLNVRPSVMKPAAQVKPGQKRRAAERSAVAAVKPLNCTSTAQEEPPQELPCKLREVSFPFSRIQAQISPMVPRSPPTIPGRSSSPLREEFQAVPVKQHSPAIPTAAPDTYIVPQSPLVKTPTQPKARRPTVSSSAMDEFDELMIEFTDDRLEDDLELDPGKGEDDYLLELSEMIDS